MKLQTALLHSLLLFLVFPRSVLALDTEALQQRLNTRPALLQQQLKTETPADQKCRETEVKISRTLQRYNSDGQTLSTVHTQLLERLQKLESYFKNRGRDTTRLSSYLVELEAKMTHFTADVDALINQVQVTQQYPCGEGQSKFVSELQKVKAQRQVVRQDLTEIRSYYKHTIRPEIKRIIMADKTSPNPSSRP